MTIEVKVPQLPESISDATVATWHKKPGDSVARDENIVDLETDKVMLEVPSPIDGILKEILQQAGGTVHAQDVLAIIEEGGGESSNQSTGSQASQTSHGAPANSAGKKEQPASSTKPIESTHKSQKDDAKTKPAQSADAVTKEKAPATGRVSQATATSNLLSPSARRAAAEHEVDTSHVTGTGKGGRITKENVLTAKQSDKLANTTGENIRNAGERPEKRVPMTRIRTRIAERLLEVTQSTAMLTTFNEINMTAVMAIRNRYKEQFEKKNKVRLGFMSFFVRACVEALKRSPVVNSSLDGQDIVYHGYYDIGVAVSTERGLIVPVLRNVDQMSMAEIEAKIAEFAEKARGGKLSLEEMQGGTFTITNGGVFGSLMSTPILNSPQCAILGMHKIEERPVAENGQVVIRPMMYVALSYDHCLIDGKESVSFLLTIKELLEDPTRLILEV